jgi:citrate lyase subunit beta/citryl-CoA lyase
VRWAERVVEVLDQARKTGRASAELQGTMVDEVHYRIAKRVLEMRSAHSRSESVK